MTTRGRGSSPEHSAIVMGLAQAARKDKTDFAEAIFEDRSAWESVMKDFLGTYRISRVPKCEVEMLQD